MLVPQARRCTGRPAFLISARGAGFLLCGAGWLSPAMAPLALTLCVQASGLNGCYLRRVTCPREGPPGPTAPCGRLPVEPARYLPRRPRWLAGPATRGTSPGRGRARRGPKPARDLRPLVNGLVASHGWESPVSHPSHSRVLPDQPVNGGLACAGRGSAAPRTGPAPRIQWRAAFGVRAFPDPTRSDRWAIWSRCRVTGPPLVEDELLGPGTGVPAHPCHWALLPPPGGAT